MKINNENDLNIEYICNKTLLDKNDELVPIILDIIKESYKAGLCQAEFDNTMELIEENNELKKRLEESKNLKNKLLVYNASIKGDWNELKKYLHNVDVVVDYSENYDGHFINYDELLDKMKELENGDSNVEN